MLKRLALLLLFAAPALADVTGNVSPISGGGGAGLSAIADQSTLCNVSGGSAVPIGCTNSGTGAPVYNINAVLTTPNLGVPSFIDLTHAINPPTTAFPACSPFTVVSNNTGSSTTPLCNTTLTVQTIVVPNGGSISVSAGGSNQATEFTPVNLSAGMPSASNSQTFFNGTWSGNCGSPGANNGCVFSGSPLRAGINVHNYNDSAAFQNAGVGVTGIAAFDGWYPTLTSGWDGFRNGYECIYTINSPPTTTIIGGSLTSTNVGCNHFRVFANANMGGYGGAYGAGNGVIFSLNPQTQTGAPATYLTAMYNEIDVNALSFAGPPMEKVGLNITLGSTCVRTGGNPCSSEVQASYVDLGYDLGNGDDKGSTYWNHGYGSGTYSHPSASNYTTTLFGAWQRQIGSGVLALQVPTFRYGLDFSESQFAQPLTGTYSTTITGIVPSNGSAAIVTFGAMSATPPIGSILTISAATGASAAYNGGWVVVDVGSTTTAQIATAINVTCSSSCGTATVTMPQGQQFLGVGAAIDPVGNLSAASLTVGAGGIAQATANVSSITVDPQPGPGYFVGGSYFGITNPTIKVALPNSSAVAPTISTINSVLNNVLLFTDQTHFISSAVGTPASPIATSCADGDVLTLSNGTSSVAATITVHTDGSGHVISTTHTPGAYTVMPGATPTWTTPGACNTANVNTWLQPGFGIVSIALATNGSGFTPGVQPYVYTAGFSGAQINSTASLIANLAVTPTAITFPNGIASGDGLVVTGAQNVDNRSAILLNGILTSTAALSGMWGIRDLTDYSPNGPTSVAGYQANFSVGFDSSQSPYQLANVDGVMIANITLRASLDTTGGRTPPPIQYFEGNAWADLRADSTTNPVTAWAVYLCDALQNGNGAVSGIINNSCFLFNNNQLWATNNGATMNNSGAWFQVPNNNNFGATGQLTNAAIRITSPGGTATPAITITNIGSAATPNSGGGDGSVFVVSFQSQTAAKNPFLLAVGQVVVISGETPSGYNGTCTVQASPAPVLVTIATIVTSQFTCAGATSGAQTVAGSFLLSGGSLAPIDWAIWSTSAADSEITGGLDNTPIGLITRAAIQGTTGNFNAAFVQNGGAFTANGGTSNNPDNFNTGTSTGKTTIGNSANTFEMDSGSVIGTGWPILFGAPPAIGGTTPAAIHGTAMTSQPATTPGVDAGNVPYVGSQSGMPIIVDACTLSSTGGLSACVSITNPPVVVGSVSNAYMWFPVTTLAATGPGATAGFYAVQMLTATTGQVCSPITPINSLSPASVSTCNTFAPNTSGTFVIPAATTITAITMPVGAGVLGNNGRIEVAESTSQSNSANIKTFTIKYGNAGPNCAVPTTEPASACDWAIQNRGQTGSQFAQVKSNIATTTVINANAGSTLAIDSTVSKNLTLGLITPATWTAGTDFAVIEMYTATVKPN